MKADLYQRITNRIVADLLLELGVRVRALRVEPVQERAHCAPTERNTANSWQKATNVLTCAEHVSVLVRRKVRPQCLATSRRPASQ